MKTINKLLLGFILLATVLLLSACSGNKDAKNETPQIAIVQLDKNEEGIMSDNLFADFEITKNVIRVEELSVWYVLYNGSASKETTGDAASVKYVFADGTEVELDALDTEDLKDAVKKVYTFNVVKEYKDKKETKKFETTLEFTQYNSNLSEEAKATFGSTLGVEMYIDASTGKTTALGHVLTDTYIFEGKGINYLKVNDDATTTKVSNDNVVYTGFPVGDDLIENKQYINYTKRLVDATVSVDGQNYEFNGIEIWLAEAAKPLSTKTATFWNWIFLQMPIAFVMSFIGKITGGSFAVAILITTIIVRTLAWPIYAKSNDMSLKMAVAQPELDRLNRKYAQRKDPESQQRQQMEMMAIYKKYNISMFGCVMPFLQMPIFFAMYEVVRRITIPGGQFAHNVNNTKFLGTDLDAAGVVAKIIFTLLVGVTMYALQTLSSKKPAYAKQAPKKVANPNQPDTEKTMKMVSYFMILMMVMTSFVTPGLSISYYWIIGNIYSIIQTLINRKISEKKHEKLEEQKLYGNSREIIEAEFKKKGGK